MYFANVSYFEESVLKLVTDNANLRFILVVSDGINGLDASGVEMLSRLVERLGENGITVVFSGVKKQVREVMERTGLAAKIGEENLFRPFITETVAMEAIGQRLGGAPTEAQGGSVPGLQPAG